MDTYMDLNLNVYEGDEIWRWHVPEDRPFDDEWVDSSGLRTRSYDDWHRLYADTEFFKDGLDVECE